MESSLPQSRAVRPVAAELYFLPVQTRVPLKFGSETLTSVICARVKLTVQDRQGQRADGWGETPLSVQWVWPSELPYERRLDALQKLCIELTTAWAEFDVWGHPLEIGQEFQSRFVNAKKPSSQENNAKEDTENQSLLSSSSSSSLGAFASWRSFIPHLAALVCCSPFDIALHDAYGNLHNVPIYDTYAADWISRDLASFFDDPTFAGKFPADFLLPAQKQLIAWHLVGGLDPLTADDLRGDEPDDGYPVLLSDWIRRDGLRALKIKLRGNDSKWDLDRLIRVGRIAIDHAITALSADFNCTVTDPQYVIDILDALNADHVEIYDRLLYVEQPFPYDLEKHHIDVHELSSRKPLFLDESAHDWRMIKRGRELGWNGVALKTCKTQSGAILSHCWARAHGMQIMVQDLTNPMLAMISHALLAAHTGTIMGVETNASQFYPDASASEAQVHPYLYRRRNGQIDLSTVSGPGYGYRLSEIPRDISEPIYRAEYP